MIGLLQKDPKKRLGGGIRDAEEIKEHKFFEDVDWKHLYHKTTRSPFIEDKKEINKKEFISDVNIDECISDELQNKFANFTMLHKINFSKPFLYQKGIKNPSAKVSDSNISTALKNTKINKKVTFPKLFFNNNQKKPQEDDSFEFEIKKTKSNNYERISSYRSNNVGEKIKKELELNKKFDVQKK